MGILSNSDLHGSEMLTLRLALSEVAGALIRRHTESLPTRHDTVRWNLWLWTAVYEKLLQKTSTWQVGRKSKTFEWITCLFS